jgi:hypothetical protein
MADIYVSTQNELLSALAKARGGETIVLKDGDYGSLRLDGLKFSSDVTIKSANGPEKTTFDYIGIFKSTNLRIDGVHVENPNNTGKAVVHIEDSQHIDFVNSEVNGKVDQVYPITGPTFGIYVYGTSSDIHLENNYVHDVQNGIASFGVSQLEYIGNTIDYIGTDAFKFGNVDGALIENNTGPRYLYPPADAHEDFMQFQGSPSSNIVIRGNVFLPQNVTDIQGIFMGGKGGHTNITIEQNIIYTGMANGIKVSDGVNVKIYNNTLINAVGDSGGVTRIDASGADVQGNITTEKKGGDDGSNIKIQNLDSNGKYYHTDLFKNFDGKDGITLEDFRPEKGSLAKAHGAYDRLMDLLDGPTGIVNESNPVEPQQEPIIEPEISPEPLPASKDDAQAAPVDEATPSPVFSLMGDTEFSRNSGDIVNLNHTSSLEISEGTIAFSFEADNIRKTAGLISKDASYYDGGGNHFSVWIKRGTLHVRFQDEDSDATFAVKGIKANQEYDVQATFDEDKVGLYVDGKLIGTKDFVMDWTSNKEFLQVGGLGWSSASGDDAAEAAFDGTISDVMIFNDAFTPQDYDFFA